MDSATIRIKKLTWPQVRKLDYYYSHSNEFVSWNDEPHPQGRFAASIKKRISELTLPRAVRKDAIVMAQILISVNLNFFKSLSLDQFNQFFEDSYYFLVGLYGEENTISFYILHDKDNAPYLCFSFVPVTPDGRLSAKSVFTRQALIRQHTDFRKNVGSKYGLERAVEGGRKKELSEKLKNLEKQYQIKKDELDLLTNAVKDKNTEFVLMAKLENMRNSYMGAIQEAYDGIRRNQVKANTNIKEIPFSPSRLNVDKAFFDHVIFLAGANIKNLANFVESEKILFDGLFENMGDGRR